MQSVREINDSALRRNSDTRYHILKAPCGVKEASHQGQILYDATPRGSSHVIVRDQVEKGRCSPGAGRRWDLVSMGTFRGSLSRYSNLFLRASYVLRIKCKMVGFAPSRHLPAGEASKPSNPGKAQ